MYLPCHLLSWTHHSLLYLQLVYLRVNYLAPLIYPELIIILEAGWIGRQAILMTGINAIIYMAATVPT